MAMQISRNFVNVQLGDPAFLLATNLCDWFELGNRVGNDYWLEGQIVGPLNEFIFNGRVYVPGVANAGTIIDNFPKGPAPAGWTKKQRLDNEGYELIDENGKILFGYEVLTDKICHVIVNIYAADGFLIGESLPDQFLLHRGPAKIGRGGIYIGDG